MSVLKETIQQRRNSMEMPLMNFSDTSGQSARRVSLISKQGFLEMSGLRSKLYVVICADRVFLYRNAEVCIYGACVHAFVLKYIFLNVHKSSLGDRPRSPYKL